MIDFLGGKGKASSWNAPSMFPGMHDISIPEGSTVPPPVGYPISPDCDTPGSTTPLFHGYDRFAAAGSRLSSWVGAESAFSSVDGSVTPLGAKTIPRSASSDQISKMAKATKGANNRKTRRAGVDSYIHKPVLGTANGLTVRRYADENRVKDVPEGGDIAPSPELPPVIQPETLEPISPLGASPRIRLADAKRAAREAKKIAKAHEKAAKLAVVKAQKELEKTIAEAEAVANEEFGSWASFEAVDIAQGKLNELLGNRTTVEQDPLGAIGSLVDPQPKNQ